MCLTFNESYLTFWRIQRIRLNVGEKIPAMLNALMMWNVKVALAAAARGTPRKGVMRRRAFRLVAGGDVTQGGRGWVGG